MATITKGGVNALFKLAFGRDANQKELNYWTGKEKGSLITALQGSGGITKEFQKAYPKAAPPPSGGGGSKGSPVSIPGTNTSVNIPPELANDPLFKQLDPDNQALIAYNWNVLQSQNTAKTQAFTDALSEAEKQADPYWGEKIRIAKDELQRTLGTLDTSAEYQKTELERRRSLINDQLTNGLGDITAEQQAELARQAQQYEVQINQIGEDQAAKGLTFSTIKERAVEQSQKQNEGVIESINRTAQKSIRDLTSSSNYDLATIAGQLTNLQAQTLAQKQGLVRSTESELGTAALSGGGFDSLLLGGITGGMATDRANDVFTRASALAASRGF